MWKHGGQSQSGVENPALRVPQSTTQNSCDYTGMRNYRTVTVQN
jgi:hypothetical protein